MGVTKIPPIIQEICVYDIGNKYRFHAYTRTHTHSDDTYLLHIFVFLWFLIARTVSEWKKGMQQI